MTEQVLNALYIRAAGNGDGCRRVSEIVRLIARSDFPKIRFGRSVKVPEELLDQWIRENIGQEVALQ